MRLHVPNSGGGTDPTIPLRAIVLVVHVGLDNGHGGNELSSLFRDGDVRPTLSAEAEGRVTIREEADVGLDPKGIAIGAYEEAP